jgi:glycosyltransferase involved in cell wall biosynthesis
MRVYLSAFSCEPGLGSEPGVGYAFALAAAQLAAQRPNDTFTLVTRSHVVDKIEAALESQGVGGKLRIQPISLPKPLLKVTAERYVRFTYLLWQGLVAFRLRPELKHHNDVVFHHVTFATEALPSAMIFLPHRVHRVLGPVGSAQALNMIEASSEGRMRRGKANLRRKVRELMARVNFARCDLVIAQTDDAARRFEGHHSNVVVEPNCSIDVPVRPQAARVGSVRRVVAVGVLEEGKRHELIIRALAHPVLANCRLDIYGTGSQEQFLRQTADDLGLSGRVTIRGFLPREALLAEVQDADCLVSASRQEGSAWSVAEAQALGVPAVAFAGSGIETLVRVVGEGYLVKARAGSAELADTIAKAASGPRPVPTNRWTGRRLPSLLAGWYGIDQHGPRDGGDDGREVLTTHTWAKWTDPST